MFLHLHLSNLFFSNLHHFFKSIISHSHFYLAMVIYIMYEYILLHNGDFQNLTITKENHRDLGFK